MDTLDHEEAEKILKLVEVLLFRYSVIYDEDRIDVTDGEGNLIMRVGT